MKRIVIGIAGGSGSGKSTVANRIFEMSGSDHALLLKQDDYYKDQSHLSEEERKETNYDQPGALDLDLFVKHIEMLKEGEGIDIPQYDFEKHTRKKEGIHLDPKEIILVEGILIFADKVVRDLLDIKIFVDTDCDVRVLRRIKRDMVERGRTLDSVIDQYYKTVRPAHIEFVEPSKRFADLIIPEGGNNEVAIALIDSKIKSIIKSNKISLD